MDRDDAERVENCVGGIDAHVGGQPAANNVTGYASNHDAVAPPPDHLPATAAPTPPGSAVNAIADGLADGIHHAAAAVTPGNIVHAAPPPPANTPNTVMTCAVAAPSSVAPARYTYEASGGSGIAPGDGDLMPPRFSGEGPTDADDWAKDFRNYVRIRRVTPEFALMLLENRLTGTARQWLENQPDNLQFDDIISRFTRRFAMNEGARNQLLATFWTRKQAKDEPVREYLEYMQSLARKLRYGLGTDSMMIQGIIQGLLPEVQRDVILQHPSTMEALTEAAAIGERNAKLMTKCDTQAPKDAYYEAKINRLEATIETMQQLMVPDRKQVATVNAVGGQPAPGVPMSQQQQYYQNGGVAPGPAPFRARGRGRGYRGTSGSWNACPPMGNRPPAPRQPPPTLQHDNSIANGRQGVTSADPPAFHQDVAAPTPQQKHNNRAIWCGNCGRSHNSGHCRVAGFVCWNCSGVGHVHKCCPYPQAPPPPSSH